MENLAIFFARNERKKQVDEKPGATMCSWPLLIRLILLVIVLLFTPLHIRAQASPVHTHPDFILTGTSRELVDRPRTSAML
jgi:hypothetical protein